MSWAQFRERRTLFTGAVLAVCLGVALVQSSLLLLISAATLDPPPGLSRLDRMEFDERTLVAVTVLAVTLGCAAFLAVFVISSTFAFTVAQRRRDLALLRLTGASPRQVRQLLMRQAVLLGVLGVAGGVPLGEAVIRLQEWLLEALGFVPSGFQGQWRGWIVAVSAGAGIGLACAGVMAAARRAAQIRPLEALRDTAAVHRSLSRSRRAVGLICLLGALALVGLAPVAGPASGQAMAMCVSLCAVLAFACFGPRLVPALGRLLPLRSSATLSLLAKADLRDDPWRSASTAAPVIVLVGLLLGQSAALTSASAAARHEQRTTVAADLVLETRGDIMPRVVGLPGVARASTEIEVPVSVTTGSGDMAYTELDRALVVRPDAYRRAHTDSGALAGLSGRAVAAGPGAVGIARGDRVGVRIGGDDLGRLPVVDAVPQRMGGGAALLLPVGILPGGVLADAPSHTFVTVRDGADAAQVRARLARLGRVSTLTQWAERVAAVRASADTDTLTMVMGLGGLYALIGLVNTVVMAASDRRRQFAASRVAGLRRRQVLGAAWLETSAVAVIGLLLGGLATVGTLTAMAATSASVTGRPIVGVPWTLAGAVALAVLLLTSVTSLASTWAATRPSPVSLLTARE
ncbi:FtsX-like permease family protein [Streptomyces olivaceoviridis]|uniref:ABC transporter permease n=1 Tax=Streptomyces olivaceoviridis TaxID=1921 RepID=UPI0036BBA235